MKAVVPGAGAVYCFDIDHQGRGLRDLITKGRSVSVFPRLSCADVAFDAHVEILKGLGVPRPLCVRVAGRMDDRLAAKPSPVTIRSCLANSCSNPSLYSATSLSVGGRGP
jgi:hypothetical protein